MVKPRYHVVIVYSVLPRSVRGMVNQSLDRDIASVLRADGKSYTSVTRTAGKKSEKTTYVFIKQ